MVRSLLSLVIAGLPMLFPASAHAQSAPESPRALVDVPKLETTGRTMRVAADGDLQKVLDEARPGDRIELTPRATYQGPFHLKAKDGDGWIVITSPGALPKPGRHVAPAEAAAMPKLVSSGDFVVATDAGAHHYRFVGIEFAPKAGSFVTSLVQIGDKEAAANALPHHIIIDRCYLHGDPKLGARRGVALNGSHLAVVDSYFSDFKEVGADSQAVSGWNGPGPIKIANNYLEAAGENIMFGGADPAIRDLVPSDIEIVRNHLSKPLRWRKGDPSFEGVEWAVKNLFELKNARRVLVNGNLLEYNWPHAQNGFAILFTVRNQDGGAPWSTIEDVTFANNLVRHVAAGINMLGRDDNNQSQQAKRIAVRNNLFLDVGGTWGSGRLFQMLDGVSGVTIEHNTALQTGGLLFGGDHAPHEGFVFQNNLVMLKENGVLGSSAGDGLDTLKRYFPGAVFRRNVLIGGIAGRYPQDNFFPASLADAGVSVPSDGDVRVALVRPFARAATDGRDPGADLDAITTALGDLTAASLRREARTQAAVFGIPDIDWKAAAPFLFWTSFTLLVYIYLGYPILAAARAKLWARPRRRGRFEPTVSIVVVAHNEADRIRARIENLLALDYPRHKLQIVIGSDGSTDGTADRAARYEGLGVTVRAFHQHRGKPAVVNALVAIASGDIVLFADARQRFEAQALRELVANFADPRVGAASGELMIDTTDATASAGHGATFYWRYEKFIRNAEAQADSTIGATGAIYAIRRKLFEPIPEDTLLDDVVIPLRIVRKGYRVVFEPNARAYDQASSTARQEFVRKTRTIAGTFQLLAREAWLLNPLRNRLWLATVSHKVLRLALPVLHATLLASTILAAGSGFLDALLGAQLAFYAAAAVGLAQRDARRRWLVFTAPCTVCLLLWATVVGFYRFAMHRQQVTWERVPAPTTASTRDVAA